MAEQDKYTSAYENWHPGGTKKPRMDKTVNKDPKLTRILDRCLDTSDHTGAVDCPGQPKVKKKSGGRRRAGGSRRRRSAPPASNSTDEIVDILQVFANTDDQGRILDPLLGQSF